jgi:hypothetical protein
MKGAPCRSPSFCGGRINFQGVERIQSLPSESLPIATELLPDSESLSIVGVLIPDAELLPDSESLSIAAESSPIAESSPFADCEGIFEIDGTAGTEGDVTLIGAEVEIAAFADGIIIAAEMPRPSSADTPMAPI